MNTVKNIPSRVELKKFGFLSALILLVLFGFVIPFFFGNDWPLWPWVGAAVLVLWSITSPDKLIYVYRPWMKLGLVLGWVNTRIILTLIFYLVITPAGLAGRLFGARLIDDSLNGEDKSYKVSVSKPDKNHMENPY